MCGIFSLINYTNCSVALTDEMIETEFQKGKGRGPESSQLFFKPEFNYVQGFHRLAINGLNPESDQPLYYGGCSLICNGEIYNYKELYKIMGITPNSDSDCEVIIHLYLKYGIKHTLRMLDGVFAFILFTPSTIYVARDPYGVRPLYFMSPNSLFTHTIGFTSELKTCCNIANLLGCEVTQFPPGYVATIKRDNKDLSLDNESTSEKWSIFSVEAYHIPSFSHNYVLEEEGTQKQLLNRSIEGIHLNLVSAVTKRYLATERPIACLLSGGLDSSLIAAIVCDIHKKKYDRLVKYHKYDKEFVKIETYSIGLPDSEDIKYARLVADHIGSNHTEIIVSEAEMLAAIPEVIAAIESYDVTTIRASLGNYLIGKYIKANSQAKVIFNGDGSDELCGGYLYMNSCPDSIEYDKETIRLLKDIHLFDVLRSDKCISSHGLEPRTPFLDKGFVNFYLSIPLHFRDHVLTNQIEKYLLRLAFSETELLPKRVLWRKKEAFSDGVSNKGRSLFEIIQDHIEMVTIKASPDNELLKGKKIDNEKKYYKDIFNHLYPRQEHLIPYYWMPKYIKSDDPSARTLSSYSASL
jgi:asparagine synthase (glutamine-hydrolysing)